MISVVLPTYNRCALTLRAVKSVLEQTVAEPLECVVVDDASTDGTAQALLALNDERIRVIRLSQRSGACAARNRGVQEARGEWLAFQDSDDVFHPEKLARQLSFLRQIGADVAVCGMERVCAGQTEVFPPAASPERLTPALLLRENLASTQCLLGRTEAFRAVPFDPTMPRLQDWELMLRLSARYDVRLCPEPLVTVYVQPDSLSNQPEKYARALRRIYLLHASAIEAAGLAPLWVERLTQAALRCGQEPWPEELNMHAPKCVATSKDLFAPGAVLLVIPGLGEGMPSATGYAAFTLDASRVSNACRYLPPQLLPELVRSAASVQVWRGKEPKHPGVSTTLEERLCAALPALTAAFSAAELWTLFCPVIGMEALVAALADCQLGQETVWAKAAAGQLPVCRGGEIRRVGVYYHRLHGGGVQRVAAALCRLWAGMGLQVTLLTAEAPSPEDEPLPDTVRRRVIPAFSPADGPQRSARIHALAEAARDLDLLVDHAWADPMLLWDLLAVKSAGCRFLPYTHSVFTMPLLQAGVEDRFTSLPPSYALADGVVTLSAADACYWKHACGRVYTVCNPLVDTPESVAENSLSGRRVLWAGRFSPEKNPMDALAIFQLVARAVPGARMTLMGGGNEQITRQLSDARAAMGLTSVVEMPGFVRESGPYFDQADVFLCTSRYEGFCLTMAEAEARGVPCVTYDLPYLTILQGGGHISVPQGDIPAAARAIIRLLEDMPLRQRLGQEARENVRTRLCPDQAAVWRGIFADIVQPVPPVSTAEDEREMVETLRTHAAMCTRPQATSEVVQTAFVPMPTRGPFRMLRKKAATCLQLLLIEGPSGLKKALRAKKEDNA